MGRAMVAMSMMRTNTSMAVTYCGDGKYRMICSTCRMKCRNDRDRNHDAQGDDPNQETAVSP